MGHSKITKDAAEVLKAGARVIRGFTYVRRIDLPYMEELTDRLTGGH